MKPHVCCLGFDPRLEDIPQAFQTAGAIKRCITDFFAAVVEATPQIKAIKLNAAFFEQYGLEGIYALHECVVMAKSLNKYIILDAKRGDIDISNRAYIHSMTHVWKAHAATFHVSLGRETFARLQKTSLRPYFVVKTTNPESAALQNVSVANSDTPYFIYCIKHYLEMFPAGGFVLGGTDLEAIDAAVGVFREARVYPYLLIPGVGRQGAHPSEILNILKPYYQERLAEHVLIPISSAIIYAASPSDTDIKTIAHAIQTAADFHIETLRI